MRDDVTPYEVLKAASHGRRWLGGGGAQGEGGWGVSEERRDALQSAQGCRGGRWLGDEAGSLGEWEAGRCLGGRGEMRFAAGREGREATMGPGRPGGLLR